MTNSIVENTMPQKKDWLLTSEEYETLIRLAFIESIQSHIPSYCPDCGEPLTIDDEEIYCPSCGLVTQGSYPYVAGLYFPFRHGLRLG